MDLDQMANDIVNQQTEIILKKKEPLNPDIFNQPMTIGVNSLLELPQYDTKNSTVDKQFMNLFNIPDVGGNRIGTHTQQWHQERHQSPEYKQKQNEYSKEYQQRPEVKLKIIEYNKEYLQRPDVIERHQSPEYKQYKKEYMRKYNQLPKGKQYHKNYIKQQKINDKFFINDLSDEEFLKEAGKFIGQTPNVNEQLSAARKALRRKREIQNEKNNPFYKSELK